MHDEMKVAVVGAGLMGHGIAQVFAEAGHEVTITDRDADALAAAPDRVAANLTVMGRETAPTLARIHLARELDAAVADADLIIEAVPERVELKRAVFAAVAAAAPADAILASNTSVIPIGEIGAELPPSARARLVGTHWWNPPHLVPLVEVVQGADTDPEVFERTYAVLMAVGKLPVKVYRDVAGFVGNRLQHALLREALALVDAGVCEPRTIDLVVKNSFGMRLPVLGPMENVDLVGLDLVRDIHRVIYPRLSRTQEPADVVLDLIDAGKLGMKTGEGLMRWTEAEMETVRERLARHLLESTAERTASR